MSMKGAIRETDNYSHRAIFTRNNHIFHARFNSILVSRLIYAARSTCAIYSAFLAARVPPKPSSLPPLLNRFTFFLIFLVSSVLCFSLFHPLSFPLCLRCHFVRTKTNRDGEPERGTIYSSYSSWCCSSEET